MPATHCRLVLSDYALNVDRLVKTLNLHHTVILAQAGIH